MQALRPNNKRAQTVITVFWVMLALELLSAASSFLQYQLFLDVQNGLEVSEERAGVNDLREGAVALLFLAAYITAVITFLRWFRRAYFNLLQRATYLPNTDAQAVYTWFIPFVNLVRPFKIMRELYNESKFLFERNSISLRSPLSDTFLGIWWALWIINNIVSNVAFRISLRSETIDELIFANRWSLASHVTGTLAVLAVIKVVSDYSKVEGTMSQLPAEAAVPAAVVLPSS
jgi:hypothetical protein